MAILSKHLLDDVRREFVRAWGVRAGFMDLSGKVVMFQADPFRVLPEVHRQRNYALQQSINSGRPHVFALAGSVLGAVVGLEHRRTVHGGLLAGHAFDAQADPAQAVAALAARGVAPAAARRTVRALPRWTRERMAEAAASLQAAFYRRSGWKAELMEENRLRIQQQEQINQAIEDQRRRGETALYAFEKERMLLARIRVGDRNEARRLLNEMLAAIYLSSSNLVVLRARAVELISCLTRAAIEDNPLMEPLIEKNHAWTESIIAAADFEALSAELMKALDDFIDGIYLHGVNRSNRKVHAALDYIGRHFSEPLKLEDVAREVGLSVYRLSHLVKAFTGRTVLQILQQTRIEHARRLLERTDLSGAQIAYDCGFGDQSYFIKHFKRLTGVTPARYRRARSGSAA
jgi:AraC-like DNA-binding protein